jgi:hypothetical protein
MTDVLLLAFIFLVAGVASVPVASKLKLGSMLGYLIAGIVINPVLAPLNVDVVSIQHFAEFGVVMMALKTLVLLILGRIGAGQLYLTMPSPFDNEPGGSSVRDSDLRFTEAVSGDLRPAADLPLTPAAASRQPGPPWREGRKADPPRHRLVVSSEASLGPQTAPNDPT